MVCIDYNNDYMDENFEQKIEILKKFKLPEGEITYFDRFGEGHIHDTYLFIVDNHYQYILQKINHHVFPNVVGLMNNIVLVTRHIKHKLRLEGRDVYRETLNVVKTIDGNSYYYDQENDAYYRVYIFITKSIAYRKIDCKESFAASGKAFANFALMLNDFDASTLVEVIPGFHDTRKRYEHFLKTLSEDKFDLAKNVKEEIDFILAHKDDCYIIADLIDKGEIPLKVTHNDPKFNNILFDEDNHTPVCIIDLDTIMPGTIIYDFGDAIRSGTNSASESEADLEKVKFNFEFYQVFADAYIKTYGDLITENEKKYLAFGAILMTLECGIRFLDDYLDGSRYFKIKYPEHNLVRARNQFKLVKEMEKHYEDMKKVIMGK